MAGTSSIQKLCHVLTMVDGTTDELVGVMELQLFEIADFTSQFDVPVETDPQMLDRYAVGPDDAQFLNRVVGYDLPFDFTRYAYFIEAAEKD